MIFDGVIVDTNDPDQDGRVKVWIPSLDGEIYQIADLPWAKTSSLFAGQTLNYPAGTPKRKTAGYMSYGLWGIPKAGAQVIIACLYDDPNNRIILGCINRMHGNRSMPAGRNRPDILDGPISDTFEPVQPQYDFLKAQFSNNLSAEEAVSRGAFERAVAQGKTDKDGVDGYAKAALDQTELDPQTYSITTPGRHSLIFQDNEENSRVRIKTANGHQAILDDVNERIYFSVAGGNCWLELDQSGRVCIHFSDGLNVAGSGDINFSTSDNINLAAKTVNIASSGNMNLSSCADVNISGKVMKISGDTSFNMFATGPILMTASVINENGPQAAQASCASSPTVTPQHEPWTRPSSKYKRNKFWKK